MRTNSQSTTSRKAGVKSRTDRSVRASIVRANAHNASVRVRQFATDDGFIDYLDSLPTVKMPARLVNDKSANGARLRREWCVANGIPMVRVYDDAFVERRVTVMPKGSDQWRPDACVRARLQSIGKRGHNFHYTRCETSTVQTRQVRSLDWSKGAPDDFHGADGVFIYRV